MCVSLVLATFTAFIAIFLFPETVHESRKSKTTTSSDSHASVNDQETMKPKKLSWLSNLSASVSNIGLPNLSLLSLSIWFAAIAIKMVDWFALVQYPVIKLHWSFPQASNIVSMEGILLLIHFSLILPVLNRAAALWLGSSGAAHFTIMDVSSIFSAVGAISIGLACSSGAFVLSVVLYLFDEGMPTATQAYIVSVIDKASVARVMASLSVASIGGKLVASISFPTLLAAGLNLHQNVWIGLPFFSKFGDGVTISYKEPGLCETTPNVRSYSGYVHLPPGALADLNVNQSYPINTFFWFFEARNDPASAPLSIWMNGGPGSSSMLGLLVENGPCTINSDSNSTTLSPWSWNNDGEYYSEVGRGDSD
ncbi:hypothetical protein LTS18_007783 [Coniosporium uncinatum]|uniref:Uncharacterized protein n=1 Tax=Coniosporium uncinatum TaxID=93489 RepID=A0ACC3D2A2_9PEZI|nr:hypothetical protein LTS18_007783 [Coniosporium uncinatum]